MAITVAMPVREPGRVIENPLSGERIFIPELPAGNMARLSWDLFLAPGGHVPNSHAHPSTEEVFRVVSGRVRFRLGLRRVVAGPGDVLRVPPGKAHHFANAGPGEAHVSVETEPVLGMVAMFEVAAAMARDQYETGRRFPRLADVALFMDDFKSEVRAPYLPAALVRMLVRPVLWLVRRNGRDAHYRRLLAS